MRLVKDAIKSKTKDFEEADRASSDLQRSLVSTSAQLEKLKASVGQPSSLGTYLQLNEVITEDDQEDELLKPGMTISVVSMDMHLIVKMMVNGFPDGNMSFVSSTLEPALVLFMQQTPWR